jgi:hypothetical protein
MGDFKRPASRSWKRPRIVGISVLPFRASLDFHGKPFA